MAKITCPYCQGSREEPCGGWKHNAACGCQGTGWSSCSGCGGSGEIEEPDSGETVRPEKKCCRCGQVILGYGLEVWIDSPSHTGYVGPYCDNGCLESDESIASYRT